MTPEQIAYVARRRRQIRYWPWLALVLVLLLAAGYGWLWQHAPININPFLVLDQFNHKTVSDEEMIMLAARGSLALATCGMFLLLIIFLVSAALVNEWRLIRILDEMAGTAPARAVQLPAAQEGAAQQQAGAAAPESPAGDGAAAPGDPSGTTQVPEDGSRREPPPAHG